MTAWMLPNGDAVVERTTRDGGRVRVSLSPTRELIDVRYGAKRQVLRWEYSMTVDEFEAIVELVTGASLDVAALRAALSTHELAP